MKIKKFNEFMEYDIIIDTNIEKLINDVEKDCGNVSELSVIHNHPSYLKIIKNGKSSIPQLLEKLDDNTSMFWIEALHEISGETPDAHYTKTKDIKESWKKWAILNGF